MAFVAAAAPHAFGGAVQFGGVRVQRWQAWCTCPGHVRAQPVGSTRDAVRTVLECPVDFLCLDPSPEALTGNQDIAQAAPWSLSRYLPSFRR
ncbi:hypothetical protein [Streptomyces sp. NPDC088358]|uniref:hypothetical protein n=1 Tax=Streptomyces sp. NPDC088358 TaxID=3365857 RepID=UPI0037F56746